MPPSLQESPTATYAKCHFVGVFDATWVSQHYIMQDLSTSSSADLHRDELYLIYRVIGFGRYGNAKDNSRLYSNRIVVGAGPRHFGQLRHEELTAAGVCGREAQTLESLFNVLRNSGLAAARRLKLGHLFVAASSLLRSPSFLQYPRIYAVFSQCVLLIATQEATHNSQLRSWL